MKLNNATLAQIPIAKPSYNRDEISIGIVHFGVGGFHRAHQAMYIDRLLEKGLAKDWGICGVGVMPADRKMAEVMAAQDGLYTLLLENPDGSRDARVIGSIVDYRYAPDDPESVIELLAAPSTRIISLTITEGGYNIDSLRRRRQRVRSRRRGAGASSRPRHRVADDRVLRQHRGQRRCGPARLHHLRRTRASRPRRVDERAHPVPEFDGGPHHPGHHARRHRRAWKTSSALRISGRWRPNRSRRGCSRTISPMAARRWRTSTC